MDEEEDELDEYVVIRGPGGQLYRIQRSTLRRLMQQ